MSLIDGIAQEIGGEHPSRAGVTGLNYETASGGNVFNGFEPPRPDRIVAVLPSGGYDADTKLAYDTPSVQIIVRSDASSPLWALDMWDAVYDKLHGFRNKTLVNGIYVVSIIAIQSGPIHIGKDDNGRLRYGMNLQTEIRNPTQERTE
jgi:hypothetical protein